MVGNALIKTRPFYANISSLNLVKSKTFNKWLGVDVFRWIVKNTFFRHLNERLKLKRIGVPELKELRKEMTAAEVSHLIGFGFAAVFAAAKAVRGDYLFGLTIMVPNTFLNLHPALLQQEGKRRIDKLLERFG